MNGKQYFINYCNERNIPCEELFKVGNGKGSKNGVFKYDCNHVYRKETQILAIKYFETEQIYIAWDLKNRKNKKQDVFSVPVANVIKAPEDVFGTVTYPVEYSGRYEELAFAFTKDGIDELLNYFL